MDFGVSDFIHVLGHFSGLSLLALGGLITTLPEMHRYLVVEKNYLSDQAMSTSVILAQITPGPNVLFVMMIGWNIGQQVSSQRAWGLMVSAVASFTLGLCALLAAVLPSSLLAISLAKWLSLHQNNKSVRALRAALAPVVVALIFSTALLLFRQSGTAWLDWHYLAYLLFCVMVLYKTKIHILWLIVAGGVLGGLGWV